jgi:putative membrane protein
MRLVAIALVLVALGGAPVAAQIGNPAGMTANTPESAPGKPAPHEPNPTDRMFVYLAGTGGMAEVDLARAAERKAGSDAVRSFARALAQDHAKANAELAKLARQADMPVPAELDPDHKALRARLDALGGAEFDREYIQAQLVDHQKTVQILEWEINAGQDAELQRYASATLPTVLQHLAMAQALKAELTGAGPQGLALSAPRSRAVAAQPQPKQ